MNIGQTYEFGVDTEPGSVMIGKVVDVDTDEFTVTIAPYKQEHTYELDALVHLRKVADSFDPKVGDIMTGAERPGRVTLTDQWVRLADGRWYMLDPRLWSTSDEDAEKYLASKSPGEPPAYKITTTVNMEHQR